MTLTHTSYPVFEADQVLSQKHLNQLLGYLEEQDRASRTHLTGMGILCGLELSTLAEDQIAISCGTAVTSLGFLIPFEHTVYTKYKETMISDDFLSPDLTEHPDLEDMFAFAKAYKDIGKCIELLPDDTTAEDQQPITDTIIKDKVVMLLMEVSLIDEKNCTTTDCADKGQRLGFKIRPLLLNPSENPSGDSVLGTDQLEGLKDLSKLNSTFKKAHLKRYNVPATTITTGQEILNGFKKLTGQETLDKLNNRVNELSSSLSVFYKDADFPQLPQLDDIKSQLAAVISANKNSLAVQYAWDWLCDVEAAYNEIIDFIHKNGFMACCPIKDLFPFHVLLGSTTPVFEHFKTPWIGAGHSKSQNHDKTLRILVQRLLKIIKGFDVPPFSSPLKITPSRWGKAPLSHRALPYYYKNILAIKDDWSPILTSQNGQNTNLSYHAAQYANGYDPVQRPLLYDVEPYNFFRIEGHIGQDYQSVLKMLLASQKTHQLPFDIIALNAVDYEEVELKLEDYDGDFGSLETDYDLVRRDWENVIGKNIEWIEANYQSVLSTLSIQQELTIFIRDLKRGRNAMVETLRPFLLDYYAFMDTYEAIEEAAVRFRESVFSNLTESKSPDFDEDLIDHLDVVIMVCQKGEFRQIFQTARAKWKEISAAATFKKFSERHPGLDHKAGVPKGGTFILVYQDTKAYDKTSSFDKKQKKKPTANVFVADSKTIRKQVETTADLRKDYGKYTKHKGQLQSYMRSYLSKESYVVFAKYLDEYARIRNTDEDVPSIPRGVVIADFFLPYRCCTGDGGVHFTLPRTEPEPIIADFNGADFEGADFFTNDQ